MPKYGRIDPRMKAKLMKEMSKAMEMLKGVSDVIITLEDRKIIISKPQQVLKMSIGGQQVFQIVGGYIEETSLEEEIEIPEEDVQLVAAQAGVSLDIARQALIETKGDLAQAILLLKQQKTK